MKTLNTLQTLSRLGKVLSKIVYIFCIIGICGCGVGILAMLFGAETLKLGGVTLHSVLETHSDIGSGTVFATLSAWLILCIGELFLSCMALRYFDNELKAGTPFTVDGANEMLHLGISAIWIPIVAQVLAQVAHGVIAQLMENVDKLSLSGFDSVTLGVAFIVVSLLCKYGAEGKENVKNEQ